MLRITALFKLKNRRGGLRFSHISHLLIPTPSPSPGNPSFFSQFLACENKREFPVEYLEFPCFHSTPSHPLKISIDVLNILFLEKPNPQNIQKKGENTSSKNVYIQIHFKHIDPYPFSFTDKHSLLYPSFTTIKLIEFKNNICKKRYMVRFKLQCNSRFIHLLFK